MRKWYLVALAVWLGACSSRPKVVVVGAAGPWSTEVGATIREGMELALDQYQQNAGPKASRIQLRYVDDNASGNMGAKVAGELVNDPRVVAVVGHANSPAMVAAVRVYDGRLPAVITMASSSDLTNASPWVFRLIPSDSANGRGLAHFAASRGWKRACILYENNSYGRSLSDAFRQSFTGRIVADDPLDVNDVRPGPFVAYCKRQDPDVVLVAGNSPVGVQILEEAHRRHLSAAFLAGNGWNGIGHYAAVAEGVYVGTDFSVGDMRPRAQEFVAAYRRKFGRDPIPNAAVGYDAMSFVAMAVAKAGPDRKAIRHALAELTRGRPYEGVTGEIRLGPDGDPIGKALVMTRLHDGVLRPAER